MRMNDQRRNLTHRHEEDADSSEPGIPIWAIEPVDPAEEPQERDSSPTEDSVQIYLREIGAVPLLNAEDEVRLSQAIECAREAQRSLKSAETVLRSERYGFERAVAAGDDARRQLIQANLRLVVSIAKKYVNGPLSLMDLVQEGNIGLMRAVEKFDYTKGHRFSTYATWWIRQAITRAIAEQSRVIRLPVHLSDALGQLRRATRQLEQSLGREPSIDEIGCVLGFPERKIRQLLQVSAQPLSLEQPIGTDGDGFIGDMVASELADAPLEIAAQRMLEQDLAEALRQLPERERTVLQLRYGLADGRRRTLEEVGVAFGITRERTRQIEAEALRHLRVPAVGSRLQAYLE